MEQIGAHLVEGFGPRRGAKSGAATFCRRKSAGRGGGSTQQGVRGYLKQKGQLMFLGFLGVKLAQVLHKLLMFICLYRGEFNP